MLDGLGLRGGCRTNHTLAQPPVDQRSHVGFFDHQMSHAGETMLVCVRYPSSQIESKVVVEHRITRTPRQQRGHGETAQILRHSIDCSSRRMRVIKRNIANEFSNRVAIRPPAIRRPIAISSRAPNAFARQHQRAINKDARAPTDEIGERPRGSQPNERRRLTARWHRNSGVTQHHASQPTCIGAGSFVERPSERNRAAPIVSNRDHRTAQIERRQDIAKVSDPLRERPLLGALREAHAELIDRNHSITVAESFEQTAPIERPRGIAVHANNGGNRGLG